VRTDQITEAGKSGPHAPFPFYIPEIGHLEENKLST